MTKEIKLSEETKLEKIETQLKKVEEKIEKARAEQKVLLDQKKDLESTIMQKKAAPLLDLIANSGLTVNEVMAMVEGKKNNTSLSREDKPHEDNSNTDDYKIRGSLDEILGD